ATGATDVHGHPARQRSRPSHRAFQAEVPPGVVEGLAGEHELDDLDGLAELSSARWPRCDADAVRDELVLERAPPEPELEPAAAHHVDRREIGRASCRERVWVWRGEV